MAIKFPDEAFEYLEKKSLVGRLIYYIINRHNIRQSVYLRNWLRDQVGNNVDVKAAVEEALQYSSKSANYDTKARACLKWVKSKIKYVSDTKAWNTNEYWQTAQETLDKRTGDCEDGAILMYCMCREAGIPSNRLLLMCGDVEGGGHCWLAYKPLSMPWNLVFLDWCYWYDVRGIMSRNIYYVLGQNIVSKDSNYIKMWWCFNETGTFISFKPTYEA